MLKTAARVRRGGQGLEIDRAVLTGESLPAAKGTGPVPGMTCRRVERRPAVGVP